MPTHPCQPDTPIGTPSALGDQCVRVRGYTYEWVAEGSRAMACLVPAAGKRACGRES